MSENYGKAKEVDTSLDASPPAHPPVQAWSGLPGVEGSPSYLTIDMHQPLEGADIEQFIPPSFFLEHLEYISDIITDQNELQDLMGLHAKSTATRDSFKMGIIRLMKKQKFKTIRIEKKIVAQGYVLTLWLMSEWTFARLQLGGTLIGKDRHRQQYTLEPGDIFDEKTHALGLEKIKKALADEGYYYAILTDSLLRDEHSKSVIVTINIAQGKRLVTDDVQIIATLPENLLGQNGELLQKNIKKMIQDALQGNFYSKDLVNREAKKLHEYLVDEGFLNSTIQLEEKIDEQYASVQLLFYIEVKQRHQFAFHGNKFFSRKQLREQISLFGKSAVVIPASLLAEELIAWYKKSGFWHVEIIWEDDGEQVSFFIREGLRIGISHVAIQGAHEIPEQLLIENYGKKLLKSRYFDANILKQLLDDIGKEYLRQGFWDFAITNYEYVPLDDHRYQLKITVNEGRRRRLTDVAVGQDYGLDACIKRYAHLAEPIPFDISIIQEQRQAMLFALHKQGRLYMRLSPELIEQENGTQLLWKFSGSPEIVRFGDTILIGSSSLPVHKIMRELAYKKGDVWDQKKIEKSVARLKRLGIFDAVSLIPDDLATVEPSKTLILKYVEDARYEVRARAGIQGVNRNIVLFGAHGLSYRAGGSFFVKNPLNLGDCFRFDLDFSRFMHDISASYRVPWIFDQPIRTEAKVYSSRYDQPVVIGSAQVLYQSSQNGMLMGLSREFGLLTTDVNVGCDWLGLKPGAACLSKYALAETIHFDAELIDKQFPYLFIEPSMYVSSLDNKIQPTRGFLSLLSLKGMMPPQLAHAAFFKLTAEQSVYAPLFGPWVIALRARAGTIVGAPLQRINPIERFYLGGAFSVRSYEPDHAPPLNIFCDARGCQHLVPIGGKSMFNVNAELRFPVYGNLSAVAFTDVGALSDHCIPAAVREHHVSGAAGFGLRINTVVGPIRFDIGWKLDRNQLPAGFHERPYAWFLVLGNAF